jgi:hypothetical protein
MRLAPRTTITEVATKLLLEAHSFDGFSELTRRGDIYAVQLMSGESEGAIELAVVKRIRPIRLEGLTGSTNNLMSRVASGEIEVLGRLTALRGASIISVSSLAERQLRKHEGSSFSEPSSDEQANLIN